MESGKNDFTDDWCEGGVTMRGAGVLFYAGVFLVVLVPSVLAGLKWGDKAAAAVGLPLAAVLLALEAILR